MNYDGSKEGLESYLVNFKNNTDKEILDLLNLDEQLSQEDKKNFENKYAELMADIAIKLQYNQFDDYTAVSVLAATQDYQYSIMIGEIDIYIINHVIKWSFLGMFGITFNFENFFIENIFEEMKNGLFDKKNFFKRIKKFQNIIYKIPDEYIPIFKCIGDFTYDGITEEKLQEKLNMDQNTIQNALNILLEHHCIYKTDNDLYRIKI